MSRHLLGREVVREIRERDILRGLSAQVWRLNPAYSPEGRAACEPVLAGAVASLRAIDSPIVGGAR